MDGVTYLVELIRENFLMYEMAFDPEGLIPEYQLPERLYMEVCKTLKELQENYLTINGGTRYEFPNGKPPFHPAVELDWSRFHEEYHVILLTQKGRDIINGYRTARGYVFLEDEEKKF